MESRDHFKNGASPKSQMSRGNIIKRKILITLASTLMAVAFVACSGGGSSSSNNTLVNLTPKLTEEQMTFCKNYFFAVQACEVTGVKDVNMFASIFNAAKAKGYSDVIHAFSIPDTNTFEQTDKYIKTALKELGLNGSNSSIWLCFDWFYGGKNSLIKEPELKAIFVEKLDNGTKIWLIEDYRSMKQARLLVKENGEISIGNLESFSN